MTQDRTLMDLLGGDDGGDARPDSPGKTKTPAASPKVAGGSPATAPTSSGPAKRPDLKNPETKKPAADSVSKKAEPAKKAEPKRFKAGTVVSYAGHSRTIGEDGFGEDVPETGLTVEEVFGLLSEDFPELSKSRAELVHDASENRIILVLKGHRKGAQGGTLTVHRKPPPLPVDDWSPVTHLLGEDGVYAARTTQAAVFVARVPSRRRVREGFDLRVPKAPAALLAEAAEFFKKDPENEALANVVYESGSYSLRIPEQETTAVAVAAPAMAETEDRFVFVQLHSHARMGAFFSGQDARDEVRTGFYGVLGRTDRPRPEAVFRFSCGGVFVPVDPYELFEEARPGELEEAVLPLFRHFDHHDKP
jgi:PRTRC genetic system protein A